MVRVKLTPERIRRFSCKPGKKQAFMWDTESPRLAVRATGSGAKSFIFESKLDRKTIRRTIGDCANWTVEDARAEARKLKVQLDTGVDPREEDREKAEAKARARALREAERQTAEARKRYTLGALCDAYVELLEARGKKKSAAGAKSAFKCHLQGDAAAMPANEVTPRQIAALVRTVSEAGKDRAAGILRSYLSAAYSAARRAPFDAKLPAALIPFNVEINPVTPVAVIKVHARDRHLNPAELREYMRRLGDAPADLALRLALLTGGQRMAQLLRAKVGDFNSDAKTLRLFDPKGKRAEPREHLLPLAPRAAALVESLAAAAEARKSPWLLSSFGDTPIAETTPGKRAAEICAEMKCETFDLRDIRRTCETMLAGMGISRDTRAQLLSHGLSGVQSAHYDRHQYMSEKRAALSAWERRLDEIAAGRKTAGNVRELRRGGAA